MKQAWLMFAAVLVVAGCGSATTTPTSVPAISAPAASASPRGSDGSCDALIGKPVKANQACGGFASPGSGGCYPAGAQQGSFYYYQDGHATVYGRDGGTWKSGPSNMDLGAIARVLGC